MKRTVLITGSSRGIGRATAKKFAIEGYNVIINYYKSKDKAYSLLEEVLSFGANAIVVQGDVSDRKQVEEMFKKSYEKFGNIDVLVNNAGIADMTLFTDVTKEQWQRMFDVNVNGMFNCCQCVLPKMISEKSGRIINIASIWGLVGASCEVHYSATKGAIISFTKALAKELGPSNILVNAIAPGAVDTDMIGGVSEEIREVLKEETPLGVIAKPEEIADVVYLLSTEETKLITGQVINPSGGFVIV
ncbi:3-oxoacyl-ACP reductase FabG [Anaerosalibacter bizertensis]|uniref:3-oxoacyl-ACP reductase FabG n=1 Tax=Anaerosalibacter bizertensis TaxID=932217 RepID=A0A9Q4ACI1_9FIRM|nr:3-oxoacyl-ACP reductase FabG [Anaerosalibacter bizertensis]MBV1817078.1 3-oxoacyl-ACP reductase FabG [Bacteroidales bacterium MSK.15.36]MCB5559819.1 3-oxoacyl-ACP reductase FabG [Anaerosalibacter bizertensis]MCG4564842.1 3-oxoacyl-ACP reductase FabG [Anaerosalibacter bizertensis]MCG4582928.1 3-oxoacyl-ACP reductase FabG [Anaerosalibacter bizertensis]MCG4585483.1 3-oxoacyl-ACP reductase FabG [Anaerosalibacter bizertensis]